MATLLQSLSDSGWAKVHLTTPNWARPTLGGRPVTFTVLMHPLNSHSSTEASKSSSYWCTTTSPSSLLLLYLQWELSRRGFWFDSGTGWQDVHTLDTCNIGSLGDLSWFTNLSPFEGD